MHWIYHQIMLTSTQLCRILKAACIEQRYLVQKASKLLLIKPSLHWLDVAGDLSVCMPAQLRLKMKLYVRGVWVSAVFGRSISTVYCFPLSGAEVIAGPGLQTNSNAPLIAGTSMTDYYSILVWCGYETSHGTSVDCEPLVWSHRWSHIIRKVSK